MAVGAAVGVLASSGDAVAVGGTAAVPVGCGVLAIATVVATVVGEGASMAVPDLLKLLKSELEMQEYCIRTFGLIGPRSEAAVSEIGGFLNHPNPDFRGAAAQALGQIGQASAVTLPKLRDLANRERADFVRAAAGHAVKVIVEAEQILADRKKAARK